MSSTLAAAHANPHRAHAQMEEDFMKAARKIQEGKKLESKLDYTKV
jgi:hypothetical protein